MKRKSCFLISVVLILLLMAIPNIFAKGQEEKEVVIRIGTQSSQWQAVLATYFEAFTGKTGIKVEIDDISYGVMYEKLKSGFIGGSMPYDIIWYDTMWTPEFAKEGWLYDLSDFVSDSTITPASWAYPQDFFGVDYSGNYSANNKWGLPEGVYGIPLIAGFRPLYYRTDLLKEAGYSRPPETLEELLEYAKKLNNPARGVYGFVMPAKRPRITYDWSGYLWTFGGSFLDDNLKPVFNSPEGVKALEFYIELGKLAPPGVAAYHITEAWESFMNGKAALAWTWQDLASVAREQSKIIGKFSCAIPPVGPSGKTHPLKGGIAASILKSSANPREAWDLMVFLLEPGKRSVDISLKGATLQRRTVWDDPAIEEMYPSGEGDIEDICQDLGRTVPLIKEWAAIDQIIAENLSSAFTGQMSAKDALDKAVATVEEFMSEAGYY